MGKHRLMLCDLKVPFPALSERFDALESERKAVRCSYGYVPKSQKKSQSGGVDRVKCRQGGVKQQL